MYNTKIDNILHTLFIEQSPYQFDLNTHLIVYSRKKSMRRLEWVMTHRSTLPSLSIYRALLVGSVSLWTMLLSFGSYRLGSRLRRLLVGSCNRTKGVGSLLSIGRMLFRMGTKARRPIYVGSNMVGMRLCGDQNGAAVWNKALCLRGSTNDTYLLIHICHSYPSFLQGRNVQNS